MKRIFFLLFFLLFPFLVWADTPVAPGYDGGDGSEATPYQIATLGQLRRLSETPSDWSKYFILTADIDATDTQTWNEGAGFSPIGNETLRFTQTFEGNSHTINKLYIDREGQDYVGLFGYVWRGTVHNLTLEWGYVKGSKAGSLAGYVDEGNIDGCSSSAEIDGADGDFAGVLIGGSANSTISNCHATGTVSENRYAGGLIGYAEDVSVSDCYATGNVSGGSTVGGLIGKNERSGNTVSDCHATGNVYGSGDNIGGFIGCADWSGTISGFYETGTVSGGGDNVGGLIGITGSNVNISGCYAAGMFILREIGLGD